MSPVYLIKRSNARQWNGAVKLLPLWLAPNMVTVIGFLFILVNVCFVPIFIPDLVGPVRMLQPPLQKIC